MIDKGGMFITDEEDRRIGNIIKDHMRMDGMELGYTLQHLVMLAKKGPDWNKLMTDYEIKEKIRLALVAAKDDIRPIQSRLNNVIARLEKISEAL